MLATERRPSCAVQPLKKEATQKVLRLGGTVTEEDQGFTHFVCLSKRSGGSGFQKSFAALWALAKGKLFFYCTIVCFLVSSTCACNCHCNYSHLNQLYNHFLQACQSSPRCGWRPAQQPAASCRQQRPAATSC